MILYNPDKMPSELKEARFSNRKMLQEQAI